MNHPNQQRLVYFHDNTCHTRPKIEEPESFTPKKYYSPKTSMTDRSSKTKESPSRQSMWLSPSHGFRSSNRQDPSNCEINETSVIEYFDPNSSDLHDPSGCEAKEPDTEAPDSSSNETELFDSNCPSFVVDFDEKAFEGHLKAATSHLKDDCS